MRWLNPPLGTIRRKFAWRPRNICVTYGEQRAQPGWALIPYVQGWHHGLAAPPAYTKKHKSATIPTGGMVASPTSWEEIPELDGWIWLEHYLVARRRLTTDSGNKSWTKWVPERMPKQWNLWHEYD